MASNILIIKHGSLGDIILATGAMKLIRECFPAYNLILLTNTYYKSLAEKSGWFNEIWIDDRKPFYNLFYNFNVIKKLRSRDYEFIFDLQCSSRTGHYFKLMGGERYNWSGVAKGCSHYFLPDKKQNKVLQFEHQLAVAGIKALPIPDIGWLKEDVKNILPKKEFVIFIPGCSKKHQPIKTWNAQGYAEVIDWLADRGIVSVLTGGNIDLPIIEEIVAKTRRKEYISNLINKANFGQMAELARHAKAVVGSDTGPMHIAAAASSSTAAIILFSTTARQQPEEVRPWGNHVIPVIARGLGNLKSHTVIDVLEKIL